jgi:flavin-dependent dehydrogenase
MPGVKNTANSRMSWKAAIAHELEGHRSAALADKTFFDAELGQRANDLLEEIQASSRASYHGKELSNLERKDLLEDALERFNQHKQDLLGTKYEGYSFNQIKEILWTSKN